MVLSLLHLKITNVQLNWFQGSGKGYLSHVFAATHKNVKVVAVEGSDVNSEGAKKRKEKLEVLKSSSFFSLSKTNEQIYHLRSNFK